MIKRIFACLFLIGVLLFLSCQLCFAQLISSSELINNTKQFDGKTVSYSGEVIGDIMARGKYAWMNMNDGSNAIGIWIKKELAGDIIYTGSYKAKGDLVEVAGIFNRACPEHGGDLDIHTQSIVKIGPGGEISHPVNKKEINLILWISGIIVLVFCLRLISRKK